MMIHKKVIGRAMRSSRLRPVLSRLLRLVRRPTLGSNAELHFQAGVVYYGGRIAIGDGSTVSVGADATLAGDLVVGNHCQVSIGQGTIVRDIR